MKVNIERIKENLEYIGSTFNSDTVGYNRLAFSTEEKQAIDWLSDTLKAEGISVRRDAVGNLFARIGVEDAPIYAFGSHLDTVKHGGLYDGALGVMTALECLIQLKDTVQHTAYELVCLIGEEGNPLGGTFGSRLISGLIDIDALDEDLLDCQGMTRRQLKKASNTLPDYKGFIELHIEQGTILERNGNSTGVVTNIAGIKRFYIKIKGTAGHSGTVQMSERNDALVSASEIVKYVSDQAKKRTDGTVATIGQLEVIPNAPTIIPGEVKLTLEVRSGCKDALSEFSKEITSWIASEYDVEMTTAVDKPANAMADSMIHAVEKAGEKLNLNTMHIVSGANHDTNTLAPFMDTGMIFVPSIGGVSHNPEEKSEWEYIENAANIMLETLRSFDDEN